jgi:SAM domain (Sterile alpha motif)
MLHTPLLCDLAAVGLHTSGGSAQTPDRRPTADRGLVSRHGTGSLLVVRSVEHHHGKSGIGCGAVASVSTSRAFRENAIDFTVLPDLTDQDLEKLGVLLGHRRKLLRSIANRESTRRVVDRPWARVEGRRGRPRDGDEPR